MIKQTLGGWLLNQTRRPGLSKLPTLGWEPTPPNLIMDRVDNVTSNEVFDSDNVDAPREQMQEDAARLTHAPRISESEELEEEDVSKDTKKFVIPAGAWKIFRKTAKTNDLSLKIAFGARILTENCPLIDFLCFPEETARARTVVVAGHQHWSTKIKGKIEKNYLGGPWSLFTFTSSVKISVFMDRNPRIKSVLIPKQARSIEFLAKKLAENFGGEPELGSELTTNRKKRTPTNVRRDSSSESVTPNKKMELEIHKQLVKGIPPTQIYRNLVEEGDLETLDYLVSRFKSLEYIYNALQRDK